jgi:RNA polymerase sigma-70 factor (ECF subfamily)
MSKAKLSLEALFASERRRLWGLAYRMTGSVEDAEDVVQEAFARLLEQVPSRSQADLAFWLVRVTTNLSIDALRRRKRRAYPGPWLPALVTIEAEQIDAGARYDERESATLAFLIALEALGPRQRAVLLLRDVVGTTVEEAARILGLSEVNVRVTHARARRAMDAYDRARSVPTPERVARHRRALEGFLSALFSEDLGAVEAWLAESARTLTDAGGEYSALARVLCGRERVARFYLRASQNRKKAEPSFEIRNLNGLPAAIIKLQRPVRRQAPLSVLALDLDESGLITRVLTVLAPPKLLALADCSGTAARTSRLSSESPRRPGRPAHS